MGEKKTRKQKPLYLKTIKYVGIDKLIERPKPYEVVAMEKYFPYKKNRNDTRRTAFKQKTITIEKPATHEVHLVTDTMTDSLVAVGNFNTEIALVTNIYGSTRTLLKNRPSGSGVYVHGDTDVVYFVMTWKQALAVPDWRIKENLPKVRERYRYPIDTLSRIENGKKVYYLQIADKEETATILKLLKEKSCQHQPN